MKGGEENARRSCRVVPVKHEQTEALWRNGRRRWRPPLETQQHDHPGRKVVNERDRLIFGETGAACLEKQSRFRGSSPRQGFYETQTKNERSSTCRQEAELQPEANAETTETKGVNDAGD